MPSVVVRAEAYLMLGESAQAIRQWQSVLDNPGIVQLSATAAIASLKIARIYKSNRHSDDPYAPAKALGAYAQFFSLWGDADADLPLSLQARREFCTLSAAQSAQSCRS